MAETYSIVLAGSVRESQTLDVVKPRLAALFRVDPGRIDPLFGKGPIMLKKGLDEAAARKWVAAIEQTGALCWTEQEEQAPAHQADERPLVPQQSVTDHQFHKPAAPSQPSRVTSDPMMSSRLVEELSQSEGQEEQGDARPAWTAPPSDSVENPPLATGEPEDQVIQPPAAAILDIPPLSPGSNRNQIPRFVKCPKCGHVAESLDDWLLTRAECPDCGLLADKFAKAYLTQPLRGTAAVRPDPLLATSGTADTSAGEGASADSGEHWLAFWTKPDWLRFFSGSLFLSLLFASLPPLLYLAEVYTVESRRLSALNLAATGVLTWAVALISSIACFYCYSLWKGNRRVFLIHLIASLGTCGVLALLGAGLSKLFAGAVSLVDRLRMEAALTPVRMLASPALFFLALILYLGFIRLPAERQLVEYLDGSEYAAKVQDARTIAGPEFPTRSHREAYEYYKYVYVETSKEASPSFDKVLKRLVADHHPASFNHIHSPDATLMVMNAIGFRDDLAKQGLISDQTYTRLSDLASLWGQTGYWKGPEDPVRRFDAQCPITRGDLRWLAKKTSRRTTNGRL